MGQSFLLKQLVALVQVLLQLLLVADVRPDLFLVQTHRTDAIPARPELTPEQRALGPQHLAVNADRALALEVPHRHRDAVLGRHAQQHVDVVGHRLALDQLHVLLAAQLAEDLADRPPRPSEKLLPAVLWQDHHVVLAVPLHVGLALPIFTHDGSPFAPSGPSSGGPSITDDAGTAEPREFSPAEPVD